MAGLALARLDEEALEELVEVLHDEKESKLVRFYTASAVGSVASSSQRKVQSEAAGAARAEQTLLAVVVNDLSQKQALAGLLKASEQSFNWKSASVKAGILQGFGALGIANQAVIRKISHLLLDPWEDTTVRFEAAWALGHMGGPAARSVLLAAQTLVESEESSSESEKEGKKLLEQNIAEVLTRL